MRSKGLYLVVVVQLFLIFVCDVWTPRNIGVAILYVIPVVWFSVWVPPRARRDRRIVLTTYGHSREFCIDPIEKEPLHHFLLGAPMSGEVVRQWHGT